MKALLNIFEAAKYLGVGETTMRDYARRSLVASVKLPQRSDPKRKRSLYAQRLRYQFRVVDLDRFIENHVVDEKRLPPISHQAVAKTGPRRIERDWWRR